MQVLGLAALTGDLLEVNDRGIVINADWALEGVEEEAPEGVEEELAKLREEAEEGFVTIPMFFPWPAVKVIHQLL
jgi:hypothetical protein